jgi:multiple sugar transport system permease protein
MIYSLYLSFTNLSLTSGFQIDFVGFENYVKLFITDRIAQEAWMNQILFGVVVGALSVIIALFLSLLLNEDFKGRSIARAAVMIPWAIAPVSNGIMWKAMFMPQGAINSVLLSLGVISQRLTWLGDPPKLMYITMIAQTFFLIPFSTLLILAGLQNVRTDLMDAAKIDGAGIFSRFRNVTWPTIKGTVFFTSINSFLIIMKAFGELFILGVFDQNRLIYYYSYEQVFQQMNVGYGAAIAWIVSLISFLGSILIWRVFYRKGAAK